MHKLISSRRHQELPETLEGARLFDFAQGQHLQVVQNEQSQMVLSRREAWPRRNRFLFWSLCASGRRGPDVGQQEVGAANRLEVSLHAQRRSGLIMRQSQMLPGLLEEQLDSPSLRVMRNQGSRGAVPR